MRDTQAKAWRRSGAGGPPEAWDDGARRGLDRLATSYYLNVVESSRRLIAVVADERQASLAGVEELVAVATRHKHEIDYTLRHWATQVERARIEQRLGSLMRISRQLDSLVSARDCG